MVIIAKVTARADILLKETRAKEAQLVGELRHIRSVLVALEDYKNDLNEKGEVANGDEGKES